MLKKIFCFFKEGILFFVAAILIMTMALCSLISADKRQSARYGDALPPAPGFTFETFLNGQWQQAYERYLSGQAWPRDAFALTRSVSELLLLKNESNGIIYGSSGYMFRPFYEFDENILKANLDAIDSFTYHSVSEVSVMVVPTASYPLIDLLPDGIPAVDQHYYINDINRYLNQSNSGVKTINVADALAAEAVLSDRYLYYHTDPNWTSYGAWIAYSQFANSRNLRAFKYEESTALHSSGFLGAYYSASKAAFPTSDEITYFDFIASVSFISSDGEEIILNDLYDRDRFVERDQYAAFLHGNHPIAEITSEQSVNKRDTIVVICDSFGYSFIPFLTQNYNKIILIDPRFYEGSFEEILKTRYNDILILMNFESICNDESFAKLSQTL